MSQGVQVILTIALLNLYFDKVFSDGVNMKTYPNYEYAQIFQNIPALFEYLLGAVEENPEILEKNDVNIFKGNTNPQSSDEPPKPLQTELSNSKDENCKIKENQRKSKAALKDGESKNDIIKSSRKSTYSLNTLDDEYGDNLVTTDSDDDNCRVDFKRESSRVLSETIKENIENRIRKRQMDKNNKLYEDLSHADKTYGDVDGSGEGEQIGFQNLFRLDVQPAEIEQRILLTEKLLEEFNTARIKNNKITT